jgi:hypothetical protein
VPPAHVHSVELQCIACEVQNHHAVQCNITDSFVAMDIFECSETSLNSIRAL